MRLNAHFYLLNEHFSQEHADAQHNGEESENNQRFEWEDELNVTSDISTVEVQRNAVYIIEGFDSNDKQFAYEIPAMLLVDITAKDGTVTKMACSESVVDSFELLDDEQGKRLNVFLKEEEPHTNPIPGIYVALNEFPKALCE